MKEKLSKEDKQKIKGFSREKLKLQNEQKKLLKDMVNSETIISDETKISNDLLAKKKINQGKETKKEIPVEIKTEEQKDIEPKKEDTNVKIDGINARKIKIQKRQQELEAELIKSPNNKSIIEESNELKEEAISIEKELEKINQEKETKKEIPVEIKTEEQKDIENQNGDIEKEKKTQEKSVEEKVEETREKYITEFKKCKKEADKQALIDKTRNATFNILAGVRNIFSKKNKTEYKKSVKPEDYFTKEATEAKKTYNQARVEMGNEMYNKKKAELEKAGLAGEDLEKALINYKATEILAKTIIDEKQKIIDMKAEGTPIKPALWKRLVNGYLKMKPRWKKVALSTLIFLPMAATGALGASAIAGYGIYGLGGLAIAKFSTSMAIGTGIGHLSKGIDWAKKGADKKFAEAQQNKKLALQEKFSKGEVGQEEYEKGIEIIEGEDKKRARNRTILKAVVGGVLALIAGYAAYDAMGNGIEHFQGTGGNIDAISGPDGTPSTTGHNPTNPFEKPNSGGGQTVEEFEKAHPVSPVPQHLNVEATANDGQGAISTLRELQNNLKVEYGNNLENAPASVKHILNTDAHKLAEEYGMYKPGEVDESAFIKSGSSFEVDKSGNVTYHEAGGKSSILEKGTELKPSETYEGKMFDSDENNSSEIENQTKIEPKAPEIEHDNPNVIDHPANIKPVAPELEKIDPIEKPRLETEINQDNTPTEDTREATMSGKSEMKKVDLEHSPEWQEKQIENTYNNMMKKIFPTTKSEDAWGESLMENPGKDYSAKALLDRNYSLGGEFYKPVDMMSSLIKKIHEVTGLEPKEANVFHGAESPDHFIRRGSEVAAEMGRLDDIKISDDSIIQNTTPENLPEGTEAEPVIQEIHPKVNPEKMLENEKLEIKIENETPNQENIPTGNQIERPFENVKIDDENGSLEIKFSYDEAGNIKGSHVNAYEIDEKLSDSYKDNLRLNQIMEVAERGKAKNAINIMASEQEFLNKIPENTPEYKFQYNKVLKIQEKIIEKYGDVINPEKILNKNQ